ncbi:EAL domain-containing protein [Paenibacillus sp. ACRRX]|uniref:putative bifunctional diguanylate cyclase/phosphodiesterase n=1 Tax=Paenibacillus sp. ACRRX TaxID=2918206 RepID=UPI001EF40954|nr:EAL domain-containing protein [Paenibacillus sp. ACRRX]MCG7408562.1 EAL domain-containing protein [Paenibacillus sp. ACRRX]
MPRTLMPYHSLRASVVCALLIILAAISTQYGIQYSYGAEFMICSAFLLVILVLFGSYWAASSALVVSLGLYFFGHGSITLLLIGLELIMVGYLYERRKAHLLLWDGVFWFVIGAPFATLFFYLQTDIYSSEALLQYFMFAMNGLLNAFIADIIITYFPWSRIIPDSEKKTVSLSQLLTHLCVAAVFIPFMINMVLDSQQMRKEIETDSLSLVETQSRLMTDWLQNMSPKEQQGLYLSSIIETGKVEEKLNSYSLHSLLKMAVYDEQDHVVGSTDPRWFDSMNTYRPQGEIDEVALVLLSDKVTRSTANPNVDKMFYRWLPPEHQYDYDTRRWNDGYYVLEKTISNHPAHRVMTFIPISYYLQGTIEMYLKKFLTLFLLCALAGGIALMVTRYITRSLGNLKEITTGMPTKLLTQQSVPWPDSNIGEVRSLVHNFKMMSERLIEMFREMHRMNEKLLDQTNMLEKSEERLQQLAYYDTLTQLPNRHYFSINLEKAIKAAEIKSSQIVLLFIDLDRFKHINDSLGHNVGDALLVRVAQRLSGCMSKLSGSHMCARLGGDEFVIVLEDSTRQDAKTVAQRILSHFSDSFFVLEYELYVSPAIGIAVYPQDGQEFTTLLKHADTAMYAAKDRGGQTYMFYDQLHPEQLPERSMLESELRKAMERDELLLHYQPIVSADGEVTAVEVLIRWNHPDRGYISPAQFIPLAEETGIIIPIGEWVLRTACIQHNAWMETGNMPLFGLSVNVSLRQFLNHDFVAMVDRILRETSFNPHHLILEITEGYVHKHVEQANYVLRQLKKRGIRIAVDDFGTGYSSLSRLKTLPIHVLKMDRSFVRHLQHDQANASIVQAVIQIGKSMNLKVMAEGVETIEELIHLKSLHCMQYQGYLISPPLAADEFAARFHEFSVVERILGAAQLGG